MSARSQIAYQMYQSVTADGVLTFDIIATFTPVEGDLPDGVNGVFVKRVLLPSDPKSDEFLRVATMADFGRSANSREVSYDAARFRPASGTYITARQGGPTSLYLSNVVTLAFDNLQTAIAAKSVLEQRIDAVITEWRTFKETFFAATEATFPLVEAGLVAKAKEDYYTAAATYDAALTAQSTAISAYNAANATVALKQTELDRINTVKNLVCPCVSYLDLSSASRDVYASQGRNSFRSSVSGVAAALAASDPGSVSTLTTALTDEALQYAYLEKAKVTYYADAYTSATTACANLTAQATQATTDLNNAIRDRSAASVAKSDADAAVPVKLQAKNDALAYLLQLCPSFVP